MTNNISLPRRKVPKETLQEAFRTADRVATRGYPLPGEIEENRAILKSIHEYLVDDEEKGDEIIDGLVGRLSGVSSEEMSKRAKKAFGIVNCAIEKGYVTPEERILIYRTLVMSEEDIQSGKRGPSFDENGFPLDSTNLEDVIGKKRVEFNMDDALYQLRVKRGDVPPGGYRSHFIDKALIQKERSAAAAANKILESVK